MSFFVSTSTSPMLASSSSLPPPLYSASSSSSSLSSSSLLSSSFSSSIESSTPLYKPDNAVTDGLIISTALSILGCSLVIFTYVRWRRLRRHPASLVVIRSCLDLAFCAEMLANHLYHRNGGIPSNDISDCKGFSFVSQFLTMGAELFGLALSIDLYFCISNPFVNHKANVRLYHLIAWSVAAILATLVIVITEDGKPIYARDSYLDICWIRRTSSSGNIDMYFFGLFIVPVVVIYSICGVTLFFASRRLGHGLPESFETRLQVFRSSVRFVLSYILYWATAGAVYGILALMGENAPTEALDLVLAFALGSRGVVTCAVWMITWGQNVTCSRWGLTVTGQTTSSRAPIQKSGSSKSNANNRNSGSNQNNNKLSTNVGFFDEDDGTELRPHLNMALRREILYYTTLGIVKSVARSERDVAQGRTKADKVTAAGINYNRIRLSRQYEETGLFALEKQKLEEGHSNSGNSSSSSNGGGNNTASSQNQRTGNNSLPPRGKSGISSSSSSSSSGVLKGNSGNSLSPLNKNNGKGKSNNTSLSSSLSSSMSAGNATNMSDMKEPLLSTSDGNNNSGNNHTSTTKFVGQLKRSGGQYSNSVASNSTYNNNNDNRTGNNTVVSSSSAASALGSVVNLATLVGVQSHDGSSATTTVDSSSIDTPSESIALITIPSIVVQVDEEGGAVLPLSSQNRGNKRSSNNNTNSSGNSTPAAVADALDDHSNNQSINIGYSLNDQVPGTSSSGSSNINTSTTLSSSGDTTPTIISGSLLHAFRSSGSRMKPTSDNNNNNSIGAAAYVALGDGSAARTNSNTSSATPATSAATASRPPLLRTVSAMLEAAVSGNSDEYDTLATDGNSINYNDAAGDEENQQQVKNTRKNVNGRTAGESGTSSSSSTAQGTTRNKTSLSSSSSSSSSSSYCCPSLFAAISSDFYLHDFEPHLFARMRELQGLTNDDYITSLSRTRREKFSEGASGAFLYYSRCDRFIVKTTTKEECEVLLQMMPDYTLFMERHPHSLLTRYFGCHALTMYGNTMYFVVMQNMMSSGGATIHERYDLKGSWVNRHSAALERGQKTECRNCGTVYKVGRKAALNQCPARPNHEHEPNQTMRDMDWTYKLRLERETAQALGDMIVRDTEFLRRHNVMDYSLILGIHRTKYRLVDAQATAASPAIMQQQMQQQLQLPAAASFASRSNTNLMSLPGREGSATLQPIIMSQQGGGGGESNTNNGGVYGEDGRGVSNNRLGVSASSLNLAALVAASSASGGLVPPQSSSLPRSNTALSLLTKANGGNSGSSTPRLGGIAVSSSSATTATITILPPSSTSSVLPRTQSGTPLVMLPDTPHSTGFLSPAISSVSSSVMNTTMNSNNQNNNGALITPLLKSNAIMTMSAEMNGGGGGGGIASSSSYFSSSSSSSNAAANNNSNANGTTSTTVGISKSISTSAAALLHPNINLRITDGQQRGSVIPFFTRHRGGMRATIVEGPGLYYVGIIDMLQKYTWSKWWENFFKTRIMFRATDGVSCIPPNAYAVRFRKRVIGQLVDGYEHESSEWEFEEDDFN